LVALLSSTVTAYGFLQWYERNPKYVVLSEEEAKVFEKKSNNKFDADYAITFDKNSVDIENIKKYNKVKSSSLRIIIRS